MHFDDRLATVLRMRAEGNGLRRIQFRQLLDLLGTLPPTAQGEQIDAAYDRLTEVGGAISAADRAAMLRDPALRLRSPRLIALLSASSPAMAEVVLGRAQLDPEEWLDLVPALSPVARAALRQRGDLPAEVAEQLARLGIHDRGLPPAEARSAEIVPLQPLAQPGNDHEPAPPQDDGIGAIVRRIEAYRRAKTVVEQAGLGDSPRLPLGEDHVLSVPAEVRAADFASDAQLRVVWCDAGVAPMLVGMHLKRGEAIERLLRQRQPITAERLHLAGAPAIAGDWQIDAAPWFEPLTGRFIGYRGRLRRPATAGSEALVPNVPVADSASDRMRQMLHELRTPVNAIQGFAEVIQQQLFGPTPHEYRALAASIVGDAARMLSAFEELERLARLEGGAMQLEAGESDLARLVETTVAQLGAHTRKRSSGFTLRQDQPDLPVALSQLELERIVWRLLATLAGTSAPGEVLKLRTRAKDASIRLDIALPAALAALPDNKLFEAGVGAVPQIVAAGVFGVGFALRLARAEARAAGGDLVRKDDRLRLSLPGLTGAPRGHSHGTEVASQSA